MNKVKKIVDFYYLATTLKEKIRSGWIVWNVSKERLESIAEHIYGTCILAIAIDSEENLGINIDRVVKMLVLHELEEVIIGDYTPFDAISAEEKYKLGMTAVEEILKDMSKKEEYVNLLNEFNLKNSKDSKFAYCCDKLEADLQSKKYIDYCDIKSKENSKLLEDSRIKKLMENGSNNLSDLFFGEDLDKYKEIDIFEQIALYVKENDID